MIAKPPTATTTRKKTRKRRVKSRKTKKNSRTVKNNLPENVELRNEILKVNLCQICDTSQESESMLLRLNEIYKNVNLAIAINWLTGLYNEGQPEVACVKCADRIMAWYKMRINSLMVIKNLEIQAQLMTTGVPNMNILLQSNERRSMHHIVDLMDSSDEEASVQPRPLAAHPHLPALHLHPPRSQEPPPQWGRS